MIVALTAKQHLPAIYSVSEFTRRGGLIAYGIERADLFRRSAAYVDRILKGEKPADLPVQQRVHHAPWRRGGCLAARAAPCRWSDFSAAGRLVHGRSSSPRSVKDLGKPAMPSREKAPDI